MHIVSHSLLAAGAAVGLQSVEAQEAAVLEKKPVWETTAAAGLTLTRGNSDTLTTTANMLTQKRTEQNEFSFGADATYGEIEQEKSAEALHGFGQYNRLFTERWYGYGRVDALHDAVADVQYRLTLSPGVGYYFIKNDRMRLSGEVGPGVVFEKQGRDSSTYLTLRIAERFEYKVNDRTRVWQSLEFLPQVDDFSNYIINAEVGVEATLSEKFGLRVFAVDTYDHQPAPGRKENDLKLVSALAYKF